MWHCPCLDMPSELTLKQQTMLRTMTKANSQNAGWTQPRPWLLLHIRCQFLSFLQKAVRRSRRDSCVRTCMHACTHTHWDSPGKSTGVGFSGLLQGILPTQVLNFRFPALQAPTPPRACPALSCRAPDPAQPGAHPSDRESQDPCRAVCRPCGFFRMMHGQR